jgi:transcriptional regulator with XRE-family HTH domain
MATFADRLRRILAEEKVSQRKIAEALSISRATVAGWLKGTLPYPRTLNRIAHVLGVSKEWLIAGREPARVSPGERRQSYYEAYRNRLLQGKMPPEELHLLMNVQRHLGEQAARIRLALKDVAAGYKDIARKAASESLAATAKASSAENLIKKIDEELAERHVDVLLEINNLFSLQKSVTSVLGDEMPIPSSVEKLLDKAKRLAERRRGGKSDLALFVGAKPHQLSAWFAGDYRPGGGAVLKLLKWVAANDAQQQKQSPEGARTPSGRKTRRRRSSKSHENPRSDQT